MNKKDCVDEATCSLRNVLLAVRDSTANIQEIRTLADSLAEVAPAVKKSRRTPAAVG
jgi:hypothetical protein